MSSSTTDPGGLSPIGVLDPTVFAFGISAVIMGAAVANLRLFSLAPVARDLVLGTIEEGIVVLDEERRVVDLNRAAGRMLGVSVRESLGLDGASVLGVFAGVLQQEPGKPATRITDPHAGRIYDCTRVPVLQGHDGSVPLALVLRDVTTLAEAHRELEEAQLYLEERVRARTADLVEANRRLEGEMASRLRAQTATRELKVRLQQAQRLESIGTFVGGIAHDFNNVLAAIMGFTEMARMDLPSDSPAREDLEQSLEAAVRAKDLVAQIMKFARDTKPESKSICMKDAVNEAVAMARAVIHASVVVEARCDPGLPPVAGDSTQIQQVLMNLCINASHAMPDGGSLALILEGGNVPQARSAASLEADVESSRWIRVQVQDDGEGMDEPTLTRVFEPFFTTKDSGRGTGLGLSVVQGIVHGHGGEIFAESRLGEGTTFSVYLPADERSLDEPLNTLAVAGRPGYGRECR